MQGDKKLEWVLNDLQRKLVAQRKKIRALEDAHLKQGYLIKDLLQSLNEMDALVPALSEAEKIIRSKANEIVERREKQAARLVEDERKRTRREVKRLERELAQYKSRELLQLSSEDSKNEAREKYDVSRASTIAIFDSIIAAIGHWSTDGQTADDFELLLQSILFPLVYEPVVSGDADYFLDAIPTAALEVVKRGREYVKDFRAVKDVNITTDPFLWDEALEVVKQWVAKDALPLLYEVGSEDWLDVTPIPLIDMWKWKEQPMSRALEFPLIFDGMELVSMKHEQIRTKVNFAEFANQTLSTQLDP